MRLIVRYADTLVGAGILAGLVGGYQQLTDLDGTFALEDGPLQGADDGGELAAALQVSEERRAELVTATADAFMPASLSRRMRSRRSIE